MTDVPIEDRYVDTVFYLLNDAVYRSSACLNHGQELWIAEEITKNILSYRVFPQRLFYHCINNLKSKAFSNAKFDRKLKFLNEVINEFEQRALDCIDSSFNLSLLFNNSLFNNSKLITIASGLYLFYEETKDMVYCYDCWYCVNPANFKYSNVTCKPLIPSDQEIINAVIPKVSIKLQKQKESIKRRIAGLF